MCKLSIIISINDYENVLGKSLDSLKNQTLKDIEILAISPHESFINNSIDIYDSICHAIHKTNGEYIFFIDDAYFVHETACEMLYNQAKNNDLDLLYVPIIDEAFERNDFFWNVECFQKFNQFNFAQICKKNILKDINYKNTLFYEIQRNSKKFGIAKQKIYFRSYLSPNNIEKYTKEYLNMFPKKPNALFTILYNYLINYPLNLKQDFFNIIKNYFKNYNLNRKNQEVYNLILNNENLIDFLVDHKLYTLNFEVYKNPLSNNNYKISVIIPIFNNETLIHRTLMSIENQSFGIENIEVLMINDASSDNTKNVINAYADKYHNFKAIHIENGTGSAGTPRNLGLKLASAEYVLFIDHDDFLEINALEKLYDKITEYNCDFVYGTYVLIDSEEHIKFTYPNEKHGFFKNLEDNPKSIITPPSIWTKLFKKEFLEKNNILFPTILGEDAIFMAKALKNANRVYYLWNDIITYYNLNENSYSSNLSQNYFIEGFASEEYLYNLFSDWGQIEYYKIRGEGILDFYLNRILYSDLPNNEISNIFPLLLKFCDKLNKLNVNPKLEKNKIAFEYIINNDLKGFLKFKNYKPSKFKVFSSKILNKINKHGFW